MTFLNYDLLSRIDATAFRATRPYPWLNPHGLLTEEGFEQLREALPDVSLFERSFGVKRSHGQTSHDRFVLEYQEGLDLPPAWQAFIRELEDEPYMDFLRRMMGVRRLNLSMHWHYTPTGCSVSPHCDAKRKLGSHIFYFNTEEDWRPEWGGETLILDDEGSIKRNSAPSFEDFAHVVTPRAIGNYSVLFAREDASWHGVRPLRSPEGILRKVFIVVIESRTISGLAHKALQNLKRRYLVHPAEAPVGRAA